MFWGFILIISLGLILVKLGTYSVWVTVLGLGLKLAILLIVGLFAVFAWDKIYRKS